LSTLINFDATEAKKSVNGEQQQKVDPCAPVQCGLNHRQKVQKVFNFCWILKQCGKLFWTILDFGFLDKDDFGMILMIFIVCTFCSRFNPMCWAPLKFFCKKNAAVLETSVVTKEDAAALGPCFFSKLVQFLPSLLNPALH
jgi:hypothetical protein